MSGDDELSRAGLAEDAVVVLVLEEETIECRVLRLWPGRATLVPSSAADAGYIPTLGRAATLAAGSLRVAGEVTRGTAGCELEFRAGATDPAARRRAGRVDSRLTVEIRDGSGHAWLLDTFDVSLGGLGLSAEDWDPPAGAAVTFSLRLPDGAAVEGGARVARADAGQAGLEFADVAPLQLARLASYLIAANRGT